MAFAPPVFKTCVSAAAYSTIEELTENWTPRQKSTMSLFIAEINSCQDLTLYLWAGAIIVALLLIILGLVWTLRKEKKKNKAFTHGNHPQVENNHPLIENGVNILARLVDGYLEEKAIAPEIRNGIRNVFNQLKDPQP